MDPILFFGKSFRLFCRALRRFLVKKEIIVADHYLPWLGLSYSRLYSALIKKGIRAIPLSSIDLSTHVNSLELTSLDICKNLAVYPALVQLEECRPDSTDFYAEALADWTSNLQKKISIIRSTILASKVKGVLLVQGFEPNNASLRAAAQLEAIPCLALENTSRSDRLIWDNIAGYACIDNLSKNFYFGYKHLVSDSAVIAYRKKFRLSIFLDKSDEHRSGTLVADQSKNIPDSDYVLFLCQVYTDAATINCLCDWHSPLSLLEGVADWCIAKSLPLVIKLHPKEIDGLDTITFKKYNKLTLRKILQHSRLRIKLQQCEAFIDVDNLFNTYSLIESASLIATLSSQAGLEAALFGKPVLVGGRSAYSGLGFTYDAPSPILLHVQLDKAWQNKDLDHSLEAARFGYVYFERYCIANSEEAVAELCLTAF